MFVDFNILNQLGSPSINSNTFANRPAAGQTGRLFVSTDTYEIYRDNGTTWDLIGGPGSSTVTGTGAATQVAYWTAAQAIGGSNNLWWDNTNGFLGVGTAAPTTRIEAVKTDGIGIYANFTTNAGSGSGTTGIYSINNTASSGYAAVIEERTANTTGGQYPLLVKHSLSAGTAAVGMGTGLQFQLPDDAGTFKTTQLTIETIDAAAATYKTRYRFNVQNNGSSTPVAYINSTGVGVFTATPSAALDIHSTGVIASLNSTGSTNNGYLAFQRAGAGVWRIGDTYNGGSNFFELHNTVLTTDALQVAAATNKTSWQATETYTTGLARGNYFDFNLSVAAGGSFSSPNAITALGATLDLTLAGNATIPSGARSGLDAYNTISFTGTGTLTHNQGTQIRAYSNVTAGWAFYGSATGTITHLAGLRALFPDNTGSVIAVTNNYALLLNDQTANTGTVTYTNRWGVYQEGSSDLNYMAANLLLGSTTNTGEKLQVTGSAAVSGNFAVDTNTLYVDSAANRVGIVTSSPAYTLDINGTGRFTTPSGGEALIITGRASDGVSQISINNNAGSSLAYLYNTSSESRYFANSGIYQSFWAGGSERMRITSGGLVGIGMTPSGSDGLFNVNINGTNFHLGFGANYDNYYTSGSSGIQVFRTGSTERMRITSGGNVLIGTTTDGGEKLQVNGVGKFITGIDGVDVGISTGNSARANLLLRGTNATGSSSVCYLGVNVFSTDGAVDLTSTNNIRLRSGGSTLALTLDNSQNAEFAGSIKTAAPTTGTAAAWKLGSRVAATVVVNTTEYIEVDIGGTLYKLATVT